MTKFIILVILTLIGLAERITTDIIGHPRDIPDAGAYEYRADTDVMDMRYYIFNNWLSSSGNGDFNHDGICDFKDYAILANWWKKYNATLNGPAKFFFIGSNGR